MTEIQQAKKRKRTSTKYPKFSLMKSLEVAKSIIENNAGEPFDRLSLAESLGLSPGSSKFRMLIIASRKYGLIMGNYNSKQISLTPLAISILKYKDIKEKENALKESLFKIDLFKKIFNKYNKNKIPSKTLFKNILERDFEIPQDDTEQCHKLIIENAIEMNIIHKIHGNSYINLERLGSQGATEGEITGDKEVKIDNSIEEDLESAEIEEEKVEKVIPEVKVKETSKPKVFIAHSKNQKILEQIKDILEIGKFEPVIAEKVEAAAIPIPEKIFGLMRDCDYAIINISADEQEKLVDGTYKINQNVLIEIGASFLRYDKKVILLVDKRIKLPSNLQGLNRCEYEGNELSWSTGITLTKTLQSFRE